MDVKLYLWPPKALVRKHNLTSRRMARRHGGKQRFSPVLMVDDEPIFIGHTSAVFLSLALYGKQREISMSDLIALVYPDPDDEPECAAASLRVMLSCLKSRLLTYGLDLKVESWSGGKSGRRFLGLERIAP